jgi:hypothetical protein
VFGSTLEEAKQLYSIDSKKILCQIRIAPAASAPGKKVEQRADLHFFWSTSRGAPKTHV